MKDYYKILGLKADVSPDDIHARWIKLMRKFHPDRGGNRGAEDERVREINEAYGVLKHPSARAHYDLERNYRRKKRNLYLQRIILPPAILIVLLIFALIYLRKPWGTPQPESTFSPALASITNALNDPNVPNVPTAPDDPKGLRVLNQTDQTNEMDQIDGIDAQNAPEETNTSPLIIKAKPSRKNRKAVTSSNKFKAPDGLNVLNVPSDPNAPKVAALFTPPRAAKAPKASSSSNNPNDPTSPNVINALNVLNVPKDPNAPNETIQTNQAKVAKTKTSTKIHKPVPSSSQSKPHNEINQINQINETDEINEIDEIDQTNQIHQLSQLTPPSLIATEEEVNQFFAQYRERYERKDIEGLLSLFSSRAVQNGSDGFQEIKGIYSDFFDESQRLRYIMVDTRIQIYQNAVEVWSRYRIDQTMKGGRKTKVWTGDIRWILLRENGDLKIRFLDFRPQESR